MQCWENITQEGTAMVKDTCKPVGKKFKAVRVRSTPVRLVEAAILPGSCKINLQPLPASAGSAAA